MRGTSLRQTADAVAKVGPIYLLSQEFFPSVPPATEVATRFLLVEWYKVYL